MWGGIEEDNGKNVQVPHAIDSCKKSTVDLESVVSPVPMTFVDLFEKIRIFEIIFKKPKHVQITNHKHILKKNKLQLKLLLLRRLKLTWFKMKKMMVRAAHVSVASIKNLNLKIIPWGESTPTVSKVSRISALSSEWKAFSFCQIHYFFLCDFDIKLNLIAQSPSLWHCRKLLHFPTNGSEHAVHHATQGEEIKANRNPCHNNEGNMWF